MRQRRAFGNPYREFDWEHSIVSDLTVNTADGSFGAYLSLPDSEPRPGLVLLQEVYGVNRFMQRISDYWAGQGFVAACPEIYWRIAPGKVLDPETEGHREQALELGQQLDVEQAVEDVGELVEALRGRPECNGKVAVSGYCLGGKLAYLCATRAKVDCAVSYYGVGIEGWLAEADAMSVPLLMHIGEADPWTSEPVRKQLDQALGSRAQVSTYLYPDTDHAFAREGAATDVPPMRELANRRTLEFLNRHL